MLFLEEHRNSGRMVKFHIIKGTSQDSCQYLGANLTDAERKVIFAFQIWPQSRQVKESPGHAMSV